MNIFWFRRDLRLDDNRAFFEALKSNAAVLPIFIFDENILNHLPINDARVSFIHQSLSKINAELNKINKSLAVFYGNPLLVLTKILNENQVNNVFFNHDYELYARERDKAIYELLQNRNVGIKNFKDQVIFEKNEVTKDDGLPYVVYTPFSRKWKENFRKISLENYKSEDFLHNIAPHNYPFLSLKEIGFEKSKIEVANYDISSNLIEKYEETRNFPALSKTSMLGVYLRFGTVSIRKIVSKAIQTPNETFWNELIWREFFMQILWHFPHTKNTSFRPKYDTIQWENNEILFQKWCDGNTGYPFVDAGMRELNATGHMHNRVRMIVASFLCKHLLIDWRWGEAYFATKLLDYEMASNVGNWQWAAGSGVDAAPYFRIFNPTEQIKKFDKDLIYIKKWIPELNTPQYPQPIVDHKDAREKCLKVYKQAVG
jgi:deoxyribodipyrimidine photo-lyase